MLDPRTWSRRKLVLLCMLAAAAVPVMLSACGDSSESQCPDGQVLSDGECVNAQN